jgi:hypothetical protein
MSVTDSDLVEQMAKKHAVSPAAVEVVLAAVRSGGGRMAQFSHADFGGMSQWSPGMSMVGDMFNTQLKAKLNGLCSDISAHLDAAPATVGSRSGADEVSYRSASGSRDCGRLEWIGRRCRHTERSSIRWSSPTAAA